MKKNISIDLEFSAERDGPRQFESITVYLMGISKRSRAARIRGLIYGALLADDSIGHLPKKGNTEHKDTLAGDVSICEKANEKINQHDGINELLSSDLPFQF
jgi:hypothetical protein